jgi:hypothetical protein
LKGEKIVKQAHVKACVFVLLDACKQIKSGLIYFGFETVESLV